jgi:hypothetical protein
MTFFTSAIPKAEAIARYVPPLKEMAKNIQTSVVLLKQDGAPERAVTQQGAIQ